MNNWSIAANSLQSPENPQWLQWRELLSLDNRRWIIQHLCFLHITNLELTYNLSTFRLLQPCPTLSTNSSSTPLSSREFYILTLSCAVLLHDFIGLRELRRRHGCRTATDDIQVQNILTCHHSLSLYSIYSDSGDFQCKFHLFRPQHASRANS